MEGQTQKKRSGFLTHPANVSFVIKIIYGIMSTKWTLYRVFRAVSVSEPFLCAKVRITAEP